MNRKWWLVSAASAVLALTAAACGSSSSSSGLSGSIAGAGLERAAVRTAGVDRQVRGQQLGRDRLLRRDRLGWRPRSVHRRRQHRLRRQRRAVRHDGAAQGDTALLEGRRPAGRDPELPIADRDRLQPLRRQQSAARPGHDREDLQGRDHDLERSGDQGRQPGREPAEHEDHARTSLRRFGDHGQLHGLSAFGRPERLDVRARRDLAAEDRRVRRTDVRDGAGREGRRRHDRLRGSESGPGPGDRKGEGRQHVRRAERSGGGERLRQVVAGPAAEPGRST